MFQENWFQKRKEYSLYLLSPDNGFRQKCLWLTQQKWFDHAILAIIGLNCITYVMERPAIHPDSIERKIILYSNYVFTVIFACEMFIKIIAYGLVIGPTAYLKSGWNILDGSLVIISLVSVGFDIWRS